jgi:hypothetical protein
MWITFNVSENEAREINLYTGKAGLVGKFTL